MAIWDQNNLPPLAAHSPALFFYCFLPESLGHRNSLSLQWFLQAGNASQPSQNIWLWAWNAFLPVFVLAGIWGGSLLLRLTLSPRCLSIPPPGCSFSGQAAIPWITEKVPHAKSLTGIHLVTKGPHGHCQENQELSLLATAVMVMTCPMGFFHSHWHTEPLSETFSSKPFETLWQSCPKALPWGTMCLCSNAGRNTHTSLYLLQSSKGPPIVCAVL